jgi:hypothetical protein
MEPTVKLRRDHKVALKFLLFLIAMYVLSVACGGLDTLIPNL